MKKPTEAKTVVTLDKTKGRAGLKSNGVLAEVKKALRAARTEVEREHQARLKAEKALTEAQAELAAQPDGEQGHQTQIRRFSFVVRLTLDEHGQFERTEIEHVSSSRKQNFLNLDGERLVAFIKACINPESNPEYTIPTTPSSNK